MAKRQQVTKLLAVMAMATSPAAADPKPQPAPAKAAKAPESHPDPWAAPPAPAPPAAHAELSPAALRVLAVLGISVPRQLRNGAPACGNVASRVPPSPNARRGGGCE
jgi:hypothetical protein